DSGQATEAFALDTDAPQDRGDAGGTEVFEGDGPRRGAAAVGEETQAIEPGDLDTAAKKVAAKPSDAGKSAPAAEKTPMLGKYKLLKKLGQGGMGAVYKAEDTTLDRIVAIKVLTKELAGKPAFVQRFQREAKVMAKINHPNVLSCYDVGEAAGNHYLAIEYVEGGSLENWLKKLGKFEIGDALHAIITIARALQHAHELNLIHRDIKPDNILLTKNGVIKVADLGLAKATDDDLGLTRTGTGAGTPIYMAPEQARDVKHVDGRCDIYALGVMLYVFLTGQPPFTGSTLVEVIEAKEKGKFKPIRSFNPDVPERLDLIVDKMLAKDVKHRYATCAEVIEELEALGLANDHLSFFDTPGNAATAKAATKSAPPPANKPKTAPPAAGPAKPKAAAPAAPTYQEPKIEADIWYWRYSDPKGRTITKKLKTSEVVTLIKSGSIDAKAQLSRQLAAGYRAIGAYSEFETFFRGKIAEKKAGKGAEKFKSMIEQLEAQENRRQRWKAFKRLFGQFGKVVGGIIWLACIVGLVAGGWYAYVKFFKP
ncbi:MAG: serine/threonine protein kinase, partial [Gemmataceae bacterium]|nr:serine/threonine protein kinase [Gemmataceae bacterium]